MTNKTTLQRLKLDPYFNKTIETNLNVWSHDQNSYEIKFEFYDHQCDKPIDLTGADMRILLDHKGNQPKIYPLEIESKVLGLAKFIMPEQIRGCEGKFTAHIYADYPNHTNDFGSFIFYTKTSRIDGEMGGCMDEIYVSEFEKALEKFKEIEDKIERNDLVTMPDLKNYTHNKMFLDEKFSSLDNRNDDLYKNKADKNYVENELNSKVDKSYVYTELDKKANKKEFEKLASEARLKQDDIKMNDLSQDVKEAMTGGSVAVVGVDSVDTINIKKQAVIPTKTNFFTYSKNLFNMNNEENLYGKGFSLLTGNIVDSENYNITHYIDVEQNKKIYLGDKGVAINEPQFFKVAFYNEEKKHVKTMQYDENGIIVLEGSNYIRVQYRKFNTHFQVQYESIVKYEKYHKPHIKDEHLPKVSENKFESIKKFVSYGDSLTFREKWQPYIYTEYNFQHVNYGIGSTTVALVPEHEAEFPSLVNEKRLNDVIAEEPDLLTINGGTNDKHRGVPIGNLDELSKSLENKNKETFYGAYSFLIETVLSKLPECKIILINAPQADFKRWAFDYTEFAEATKKIALYYSLPCADWHGKSGVNKTNVNNFTIDGLHQNEKGGLRAANSVIEAMNVYKDV